MSTTEIAFRTNTVAGELIESVADLARTASVEINVPDEKYLAESRHYLPSGTAVYVSHLPGQEWTGTIRACVSVRDAGFEPIPHLPVRLVPSEGALAELLGRLRQAAQVREILLISGDYPQPTGPFHAVAQVLATGLLEQNGLTSVSVAGHPEGHPRVALDPIRTAERDKVLLATQHGLKARLVTQFLFESDPFIRWANEHRAQGLATRFICGLAGPAKISTLVKYAMRCGVGPSIRALGIHGASLKNLLGEHGPDKVLRQLAEARIAQTCDVDGIHVFCFGGFLRTVRWLSRVGAGAIQLRNTGGFEVDL